MIGSDLRSESLCDQIFAKPIHWSAATNFPETATHVIDFGPGGWSGIGLLTSRNLDGRGVRIIVIGERESEMLSCTMLKRSITRSGGARNGVLR